MIDVLEDGTAEKKMKTKRKDGAL